ncbi:MAG: DUF4338 domain-containing protein [Desulfobacterales bacterium]|nr:DUF4338 domain-containing protein [Desulfobacterales bacterium]
MYLCFATGAAQIDFIRRLIAEDPAVGRSALSRKVCEAWEWRQPNGQLCDMICRGLLLQLEREGLVKLPPRKSTPHNPLAGNRKKPPFIEVDRSPIRCKLKGLGALEILSVRRTPWEKLVNRLIEHYDYLGYCHPVGEQIKYLVSSRGRPIACFTFSSAPRHLGARDRFIGWSAEQRKANIRLIAYQSRFLILPWVEVRYLASHLLSRISKRVSSDWEALYRHPIYFLETFTNPTTHKGSCYRAAGWLALGLTTGRGKDAQMKKPNRPIKVVWGYPLSADFRRALCGGLPA